MISQQNGLDLAGMLKSMHDIATDQVPFDLMSKNCSATTAKIIHGGLIDKPEFADISSDLAHLEQRYTKSGLLSQLNLGMHTPQGVHNVAEALAADQKSFIQQLLEILGRLRELLFGPSVKQAKADEPAKPDLSGPHRSRGG